MELLVIRHAVAEDRLTFATSGRDDDQRPLTSKGSKRMIGAIDGLRTLVPVIDVIATSPLTRAVQTGRLIADSYAGPGLIEVPALAPGIGPDEVGLWLATQPDEAAVALVGHEPDLSELIAWLTTGTRRGFVRLRKGGACLLDCDAEAGAGGSEMQWLLTPKQLRMMKTKMPTIRTGARPRGTFLHGG